jgi:hypothetical protein
MWCWTTPKIVVHGAIGQSPVTVRARAEAEWLFRPELASEYMYTLLHMPIVCSFCTFIIIMNVMLKNMHNQRIRYINK